MACRPNALSVAETSGRLAPTWYRLGVTPPISPDRCTDEPRQTPMVVAVVLNWNNLADTLECVESLLCSDYENLAVLVVDNNSREDPTTVLQEKYPAVHVLRNPRNKGYGGGNNTGIRWAIAQNAAYILLLNNDATVAPDMVQRLVRVAEADPRIGLATPRVFYYDRPTEVYWDGGIIDWETGDAPHDSRGLPAEDDVATSEWLDGCALFASVKMIQDIGLLDDRYFLYFEDTDWSVRAARRGWMNAVITRAHAWHKVSRSTGGIANPAVRFYYVRNRYLFLKAHRPAGRELRWRTRYFLRICRDYVGVRHEREARVAVIAAFVSLLIGRWGPYQPNGSSRRVVLALDAALISMAKCARPIKRFLGCVGSTKRVLTGGKRGGGES